MKKIDKIPDDVDLDAIAQKWIKIGLNTDQIDRDLAKAAVCKAYECAGLKPPEKFIFLESPLAGAVACVMFADVRDQVWDQVWAQVRDQVRDQVWDQVRVQVWAQVRAQVWAQVRDQVWAQVWAQVRDQVWAQVRDQVWDQLYKAMYGHCDADDAAFFHDAMRNIGVEGMKKFDGIAETARECGCIWPFDDLAIITDRPCEINMEDGMLHCETGPAIRYRDGFSIYAWRGTRVPAEWIEKRDILKAYDILKEENVELRAIGMEIIGWDKAMDQLNFRVIDDSGDPDVGKLVEMELPGLSKHGLFLIAECPRNGRIVEGVPYVSDIDGKPIDTVIAAQAWRIGDPQDEYIHPERRT